MYVCIYDTPHPGARAAPQVELNKCWRGTPRSVFKN